MANETYTKIVGTHPYTPENYQVPNEPEIRERLEWFKDQKFGCMMHWGPYTQIGSSSSWPLVDNCADRFRKDVDWIEDAGFSGADQFKQEYFDLNKTFNPIQFKPDDWANLVAEGGFKYFIFTTKHHDGFCMWDTQYSDYKITAPDCPFSKHKYANVTKELFDAMRARGLGISAYFSKPDFHHEDFWENHGIGFYTDSHPTYKAVENPERWAKFREFTKNQIVEIVRDLGPIDVIWLDGGWVRPLRNLGIDIDEIIATARQYNPRLIAADRLQGGQSENFITPEQKVPDTPLAVPWESCITMSSAWTYRFDDPKFKSKRELVHLLLNIVAKGGNLALNIAPTPAGRIPRPAIERVEAMGAWLKKNGEGIYATRPIAPYKQDDYVFTQKGSNVYAFKLYEEDAPKCGAVEVLALDTQPIKAIRHLGSGLNIPFTMENGKIMMTIPEGLERDEYAEGFALEF